MKITSNIKIENTRNQNILLDHFDTNNDAAPLAIFCHGFKGFKDWGHWGLIGESFLEKGINFVKFNYANNGTTLQNPLEFGDLEAFEHNDYIKELDDLETVINWAKNTHKESGPIFLIGHSRSGPIVIIKGMENPTISGAVSWAGVKGLDYSWRDPSILTDWKKNGHLSVINGRTGQTMRVGYGLYESFKNNKPRLDFTNLLSQSSLPILFVHGKSDPAVHFSDSEELDQKSKNSTLVLIENADHVFNASHPWTQSKLPDPSGRLVKETVSFIKRQSTKH